MAGLDSSIYGNLQPPKAMSLGDIMGLATSAQAYKQAQQVNPLQVQQQQAVTQGAQAQATMKQQEASEQQDVKDFLSNPTNYQDESGNPDYSKLQKNVMALAPTTGAEIINKIATTHQAQTTAKQSFLNLGKSERDIYNTAIGPYAYASDKNPQNYINAIKFAQRTNPDNKEFVQHGNDLIKLIDTNPGAFINNALEKVRGSQTATEQESNLAQKNEALDVGGKIIQVTKTPQTSTKPATLKQTGIISVKTLTPQVVPGITGGFTVIGGGGGGDQGGAGTSGVPNQNAISPAPGQTVESTKANINTGINDYREAVAAQSDPNNPKGHVPTKLFNNKNILTLLKDPEVDTAHIANYFSDPLKYKFLTPKEQDLAKYLEQRVQGLNPSSVMDLQSKHQAYGTTALKKEALMELMRNESGSLATEDLLTRGRKNAGGNPNQPNASAVNNFNNAFSNYASDPLLMKYIGIVGEGKTARLDKQDQDDIGKLYARLPKDKNGKTTGAANALELKRQALLRLVDGSK